MQLRDVLQHGVDDSLDELARTCQGSRVTTEDSGKDRQVPASQSPGPPESEGPEVSTVDTARTTTATFTKS